MTHKAQPAPPPDGEENATRNESTPNAIPTSDIAAHATDDTAPRVNPDLIIPHSSPEPKDLQENVHHIDGEEQAEQASTIAHGGVTPLSLEKPHAAEQPNAMDTASEATTPASPSAKAAGFLGKRGTAPIRLADQESEEVPPPLETAPSATASETTATDHEDSRAPHSRARLKAGMAENSFLLMSFLAPAFLLILLALMVGSGVWFPSVYLPAEVAIAEVYGRMAAAGLWLVPAATTALPASLPGYYWFMAAVDAIPLSQNFLLPLTAALAALTALLGTYALGICARLGNKVSFAAGLILLSCLSFVPLTHMVGAEILQAGLLALSLGCLYRGWTAQSAPGWLCAGFLLAAAATLVGGLMALWIPLLSSLLFVVWRGTLRRGHKLDAVIGFGLLVLALAGWLSAVILWGGDKAPQLAPLASLILTPWTGPLPTQSTWWQGLAGLALGLLPWILVPFFVSWGTVLVRTWDTLKAARKERSGAAWLWIALFSGLPLLLFNNVNPCLMTIPLLPLAALLLAKALLNLSPNGSRLFFLLLSVLCLLCGVALTIVGIPAAAPYWTPHVPAAIGAAILPLQGLPILAGILLLGAVALLKLTNRAFPGGALLVTVLFSLMLVQSATLLTGPSLVGHLAQRHDLGIGVGLLPGQSQPAPTALPQAAPAQPATEAAPASPEAVPAAPEAAAVTPEGEAAVPAKPAQMTPADPSEAAIPKVAPEATLAPDAQEPLNAPPISAEESAATEKTTATEKEAAPAEAEAKPSEGGAMEPTLLEPDKEAAPASPAP